MLTENSELSSGEKRIWNHDVVESGFGHETSENKSILFSPGMCHHARCPTIGHCTETIGINSIQQCIVTGDGELQV